MNLLRNLCIIVLLGMICFPLYLSAENDELNRTGFEYDVDFEMKFDNREFYKSDFSNSMTIFGVRLTPSVGIYVFQPEKSMKHRVMLGLDIMKDFGASAVPQGISAGGDETYSGLENVALLREMTLYYNLSRRKGDTDMQLYTGIFPRRISEGEYSDAFFSDSLKFYDNNLEGLLLKIRKPRSYFEVGCDWMGKFGLARKEKFMIFSSGRTYVTPSFSLGYSAYMYHFAGSRKARGVVDNVLLNPYMRLDFSKVLDFDVFALRLGWLLGMQHDREFVGHYVFPGGGELDLDIRKWNFGLNNHLFYGYDMMPYYNSLDAGGDKYGNRLYMGDLFYRIHDDGTSGPGTYDRLDVYYEPIAGKYLSVRISARFHFHGFRYSGCQQIVGIRFNINEMINPRK